MAIDWTRHYTGIYSSLGIDALLYIDSDPVDVVVIDKTAGVVIDQQDETRRHSIGVGTIKPACCVRTHELELRGVATEDLRRKEISFNSKRWRIESLVDRPSPSGLAIGELMLILSEVRDGSA